MFASKDTLLTRPSGYTIARSVRLRSSAGAYLNRTELSGNRQKWTLSFWIKLGTIGSGMFYATGGTASGNTYAQFYFTSSTFNYIDGTAGTGNNIWLATNQVFRDPSAWYHIIIATDTTQATASNRVKLYVNGSQVTSLGTATYPSQNYNTRIGDITSPTTSSISFSGGSFDGYVTEFNYIDGQQLTPSSFGTTNALTGVWQPAKYTGTYGTNGFYLNFSDNSSNTATTIGKDYSGNGNNWTPNNISVTAGVTYDSMVDSPTVSAVSSNYAVMNPLDKSSALNITDGNLKTAATTGWCGSRSTFSYPSTGKYYWEATCIARSTGATVGLLSTSAVVTGDLGAAATGYVYNSGDGNKYNNSTNSAYGSTWTTNDVIGVAWDADAGTLSFYKNGTSQGNAYTGLSGTFSPAIGVNGTDSMVANFGQRPFSYTPPTGFVALNTYNLPASTIKNGAAYMAATTYTGNGSTQSITNTVNGVNFQPDMVWAKNRSNVENHQIFDSVRGVNNALYPNLTNAAGTDPGVTAFNSNGFSLGGTNNINAQTYVGWQWKAGGSSSSNTNGSITSTVSVGATQGFSVVTYTGTGANATVGHGLGVAPSMIIAKDRGSVSNWNVYHTSLGNTQAVLLNSTNATNTSSGYWNNTSPTSTVFSVGTGTSFTSGLAYCFAAVAGYSAFGSYTGNGSADGPFVFTNFRPRWILLKRTDSAADWFIGDTSRNTANSVNNLLQPSSANAESTYGAGAGEWYDLLSNGFKIRSTITSFNASGGTYIYACFAENPLKYALAR